MKEYISRDDALLHSEIIRVYSKDYGNVDVVPVEYLADIPAADVQSLKHGHWYHNTSKYISELDAYFIQARCSYCGKYSDRVDSYSQQMSNECCSHCGARMDLKDGDTNERS